MGARRGGVCRGPDLRNEFRASGSGNWLTPATADEAPKYGGTLTYMIPADSPPSFDAQREADDVGSRFRIVGIDPYQHAVERRRRVDRA